MRDDRPIADDKLLRILRPKIDDSGRYTCLAHNVLGSANRSYNLVVTCEYIYTKSYGTYSSLCKLCV